MKGMQSGMKLNGLGMKFLKAAWTRPVFSLKFVLDQPRDSQAKAAGFES